MCEEEEWDWTRGEWWLVYIREIRSFYFLRLHEAEKRVASVGIAHLFHLSVDYIYLFSFFY